jgi:hypothetical protein
MSRTAASVNQQLFVLHAIVLELLGQQVLHGDVGLLVLGVTRQANHFHAVEQCRRNVHRVRGRHEHHVAQIEVDLDVVVAKGVVLLRVQHLQQRARRVAPEIGAQLVDLVQQEQRIARTNLAQALQHLARHGADVGASVPADFGFVAHAAQRHAYVLAPRGFGNRLAQRGLAHAGWPHQAQNGRLDLVHALLHGKVFKDAVLDLIEAEVVFVEHHRFGVAQIVLDLGLLAPGQSETSTSM